MTPSLLDVINTFWPIVVGIGSLIVVLAKMHTEITVLKEKVSTLYHLWNERDNHQ